MENISVNNQRLLSLDILRGLDLAFLVLIQPIIYSWLVTLNPEPGTCAGFVLSQVLHLPWEGFCFWDIIMPLFMFMSGITIPFAMSKYKTGKAEVDGMFFARILKRFIVLWVMGMVIQGNLLALDINKLCLFSNTLQSIAVGYVVVAILFVFTSLRTQAIVVALSFIVYIAVFAIWGGMSFTIDSNICEQIDRVVLGHFRDGVIWNNGSWTWDETYHYTWILSSLNFIVTVFLGCLAGYILRNKNVTDMKKFTQLMLGGAILIVVSLVMSPWIPIIKHIWSSSMTLFAGGICFLLMGLFYYVIDIKHRTRGIGWLKFYGMNSITAYFLGEYVNFDSITNSLFYGFEQWMGEYYIVIQAAMRGVFVLLILRLMYKYNLFIKA